jgi:hypothetical protein
MQSNSPPGRRQVSTVIIKVAVVAVLLILVLWGRVFYGSMQDYETGETLLKEKQTIRAITYFDRSLHWYAPLNPYVESSAKRLWEIGERAEQEKDPRLAVIAYESIRNAFYGSRHVFRPGKDWVRRTEGKIRVLSALQGSEETVSPNKELQPDVGWSVILVLSFFGWVGSLLGFARWGMGKEKRSGAMVHRTVVWIGLAIVFFGLWILGMALA